MKKLLKTGITIMAVACMLTGLVSAAVPSGTAKAAEGLKNWTYATAGITDGDKNYEEKAALADEQKFELGGSKFSGYVTFSHVNSGVHATGNDWAAAPRIVFGADSENSSWTGKSIKFGLITYPGGETYLGGGMNGENGWIFLGNPISANTEIFLQVAFEYVAKDSDNVKNDLQIHVWVNGTEVSGVTQTWGAWATVTADDMIIKDYADSAKPIYAQVMLYAQESGQKLSVRSAYGINVTGIENNKQYCDAVTVNLATAAPDKKIEKDLAKVTVGDVEQAVTNGSFSIPAGAGEKTIKITDKTGVSQTYTITVNNGHTWGSEYVSNNDATCKQDGTKRPKCSVCGDVNNSEDAKVKDEGSKLEHVFENYVSDNDATCVKDGHETAECKYGCGTKDKRVVKDSATGEHIYGDDGKCTECGAKKAEATKDEVKTEETGSPKTGDSSLMYGLLVVVMISIAAIAVITKRTRMEQ